MTGDFAGSPFSLQGRTALITGGGSGLGFAMASCMARAGARVAIAGRREEVLMEACEQLGENAFPFVFDIRETGKAAELAARVHETCGGLDILVNNAGIHSKKSFDETLPEDLDALYRVHVSGGFALAQACVPYMERAGGGSIIWVSSEAALVGIPLVNAYSAAKAALLGLTKSLTADLAARGIRVNVLVPGFIDTPMFRKATDSDPERRAKILGHTPMRRFGDPMEIGWAAVYLASPAASFITGHELVVDGGFRVGF